MEQELIHKVRFTTLGTFEAVLKVKVGGKTLDKRWVGYGASRAEAIQIAVGKLQKSRA